MSAEKASSAPRPADSPVASPDATAARPASDAGGADAPGWARAIGLGVFYAVLVVALLLLARAGTGFIYQGF
ncbi:MAG: hypothetical protein ACKPBU_15975 [Alphaproteobacteria bacterium]